jgi:DNA-directed RNA polymerase omega subunit
MTKAKTDVSKIQSNDESTELYPGIDSHFRLVAVAALRAKQLLRGARPRIESDPHRRRNTSIALEEVKRGLVSFSDVVPPVVKVEP